MKPKRLINLGRLVVLALLALLSARPERVWAQDPQVNFTLRGRWPEVPPTGEVYVRVAGSYAYVGGWGPSFTNASVDGRLIVLDVSAPTAPQVLSYCEVPGVRDSLLGIAHAGRYVYLVATPGLGNNPGVLGIVDIADPTHPVYVGGCSTAGASDVAVAGSYAYLAGRQGGLLVVDASNPSAPVLVATGVTSGYAQRIRIEGQTAYLGLRGVISAGGEQAGLDIIDISTPTSPVLVGSCTTGGQRVGGLDLSNGYAFVGDYATGSLIVIDVRDRTNPAVVGRCACWEPRGLRALGDRVFVVGSVFSVFDVANPAIPSLLAELSYGASGYYATVDVAGRYAFGGSGGDEVVVFDVGDSPAPTLAARLNFWHAIGDILVRGTTAYLATGGEIKVIDLSNPTQPTQLGRYEPAGNTPDEIHIDLAGDRLLVTANYWRFGAGPPYWELVDLSDPHSPRLLHHEDTAVYSFRARMVADGAYLLQTSEVLQLQIIDLSDAAHPAPLSTCTLTNTDWDGPDFEVAGHHAYVADGRNGVQVVDMTDPAHPVHTHGVPLSDCSRVRVAGQYAYAACRGWNEDAQVFRTRLQVLDLANPAQPVKVARCDLPFEGVISDLRLGESHAFFALGDNGVWVVDIRNPLSPVLVGTYSTGHPAWSAQPAGTTVCVTQGPDPNWVSVLEMSLPGPLKLNPPVLSVNTVTLSWNGGPDIKLQRTPSLTNPNWQELPGSEGVSQIELPRDADAAFFRLIQP